MNKVLKPSKMLAFEVMIWGAIGILILSIPLTIDFTMGITTKDKHYIAIVIGMIASGIMLRYSLHSIFSSLHSLENKERHKIMRKRNGNHKGD